MNPDPWLESLADEAQAIQVATSDLLRRLLTLQNGIDTCRERNANYNSWRYLIPEDVSWDRPILSTAHWVIYNDAHPQPPAQVCFYHSDRRCPGVWPNREEFIIEPDEGWRWFLGRNHIWAPCAACLARRVRSISLPCLSRKSAIVAGEAFGLG